METKVSSRGQILLPVPLRRRLGIESGDRLDISEEDGRIVLKPQKQPKFQGQIVIDPETGFAVLDAGPDAPILTSEMVRELLVDFP
jgi:AbrB family looped-hinge helix DNA binding protein